MLPLWTVYQRRWNVSALTCRDRVARTTNLLPVRDKPGCMDSSGRPYVPGNAVFVLLFMGCLCLCAGALADGCTSCQVPFPMEAGFIGSPLIGNAPLIVTFLDTSTQSPDSWFWDFGDGTTSNDPNPVHTYNKPGTYRVTLTVKNAKQEGTIGKKDYVIVRQQPSTQKSGTPSTQSTIRTAPTRTPVSVPSGPVQPLNAAFSMNSSSGFAPLAVAFTDRSTGTITNWIFDFGDGMNATGRNPVHVYPYPGKYTVTLFITGPGGASVVQVIQAVCVSAPPITPAQPKKNVTPTMTKKPFSKVKFPVFKQQNST